MRKVFRKNYFSCFRAAQAKGSNNRGLNRNSSYSEFQKRGESSVPPWFTESAQLYLNYKNGSDKVVVLLTNHHRTPKLLRFRNYFIINYNHIERV